jgi:hypothetical protein
MIKEYKFNSIGLAFHLEKFKNYSETPTLKKYNPEDSCNQEDESYFELEVGQDEVYLYGTVEERDADFDLMQIWIRDNYKIGNIGD